MQTVPIEQIKFDSPSSNILSVDEIKFDVPPAPTETSPIGTSGIDRQAEQVAGAFASGAASFGKGIGDVAEYVGSPLGIPR